MFPRLRTPSRPRPPGAALLLAGLLLSSCAPLQYSVDTRVHDTRKFTAVIPTLKDIPGATLYQGVTPGIQGPAAYAIEVPQTWNGTLIMYTHGYAGTGTELKVQTPALREYWLSQGYAWAASSYSANYYDVRAGVEDTNALALAFPALTGKAKPSKYLIMGFSMGGHVAGAAVEAETARTARSRVPYAAAMPLCGVMDQDYEFQWLGDYTLAAAQLAGTGPKTYPDASFQKTLPQTLGALFTSTAGPLWQENDGAGARLRELAKSLTGGERPVFALGFRVGGLQQAVLSTGGADGTLSGILPRNLYGNQGRTYRWTTGEAPTPEEVAFNAALVRVSPDREPNPPRWDGVRWLPRVNGEIGVPVLTMHTTGDFYVPFKHQQLYRRAVDANGHGGLLVQRAIRAAGHCEFNAAELVEGFNALVAWEKTGQKPAGDDVLTPAVVADPNYGCAYTRGTRPGVAPCPGAPAGEGPASD
ncbi:alpha/beta hydrolase [Deinococcus koreensis]|uniref:Alpha/beta hydrolase n=1 Tax=Deinococcus koreensis TaxID=2054903 RepID=A0A2K3UZL7_9DEIO|nr:alpha/beta hydrolase [Deinococcus koreensis]PNY81974.1 alpha/beta hydrolase [Deinococcus koreensis]